MISVLSYGSITGLILFNFSINGSFFFVSSASVYNFINDNSLPVIAKTVAELKNTLQSESEAVVNGFENNKMIVNPEKIQAIILDKRKHDHFNKTIKFDNKAIKTASSVRLPGVQLDDKLEN